MPEGIAPRLWMPADSPVRIAPFGAAAFLVYAYLCMRADRTGLCWPSITAISTELRLSRRTVIRAVATLEAAGEITRDIKHGVTTRYRLVPKRNYPDRELVPNGNRTGAKNELHQCQMGTEVVSQMAQTSIPNGTRNQEQELSTRTNTSAKRKKRVGLDDPEGFERFYTAYPRKTDRADAERAFPKAVKDLVERRKVATSAEAAEHLTIQAAAYARQCHANQTEKRYIKHPAVWLNKGSYLDEEPEFAGASDGPRKPPVVRSAEES